MVAGVPLNYGISIPLQQSYLVEIVNHHQKEKRLPEQVGVALRDLKVS